jgi:FkbM family methyltransferase
MRVKALFGLGRARRGMARLGLHVERFPPRHNLMTLVVRILERAGVATVLDMGANRGQWAERLRMFGYRGRIISFEPDPIPFTALAERVRSDPRWSAVNSAVGASTGRVEFNASDDSAVSSLFTPRPEYLLRNPAGRTLRKELVSVTRLDGMLNEISATDPLFLKSDAQGGELGVLEGAGGLMDRVVGVQVELSVRPIYDGSPDHQLVAAALAAQGFVPAGFFTVDWDASLRLVEYDGVFVRDHR